MLRKNLSTLLICWIIILSANIVFSQPVQKSNTIISGEKSIKGQIISNETGEELAYSSVYFLNKGTGVISNESGNFSLKFSDKDLEDTLRIQYIGYQSRDFCISELDSFQIIKLKEEIYNLSETIVFGTQPDPRKIVENVLLYKDSNYLKSSRIRKVFIRERENTDIEKLRIDYKKSTISAIDKELFANLEESFPRNTISYTDFLGNLYLSENKNITEAIRAISLREKDMTDISIVEDEINNALFTTKKDEYWKIKSGIISLSIDDGMNDSIQVQSSDSIVISREAPANVKNKKLFYFNNKISNLLSYSSFAEEKQWDFLYNAKSYNFKLIGGTRISGDDVYIIEFTPKRKGDYFGKLYISIESFALVRADYSYAPEKSGTDFHMLGVGYSETVFEGSVFFEKQNGKYAVSYISLKKAVRVSFDRNLQFIKKKRRWLFDKKIEEIKSAIDFIVSVENSMEMMAIDFKSIENKEFDSMTQEEHMDVIYVDEFDDNLWSGYNIIEPTASMKKYKKQFVEKN